MSFRTSVILYLPVGRVWLGFLKFSVFLNGLFKFFSAHKLYYTFPHLIHTQCQRFLGSSYITNTHQNNPDLQQLCISHHDFSIITFCNLTVRQNIFDPDPIHKIWSKEKQRPDPTQSTLRLDLTHV